MMGNLSHCVLVVAMFAMVTPVQAAHDLTITSTNLNKLVQWTYNQYPYYAWNYYCGTYSCGYLLKWDWYGNTLDAPYKNSKNIQSSYGTNGIIKATTTTDYAGTSYLWGECVSFVKALSHDNTWTGSWTKGATPRRAVNGNVARGTAIANFKSNGYYDASGDTGHVAFFDRLYYENGVLKGIVVWDQNWFHNGVVGYHVIPITGTWTRSDANAYYVVQVP